MNGIWRGVIPAITTPFHEDFSIDHAFFAKHCEWLMESGCSGVVVLGSLGEGATLSFEEKRDLLQTAVKTLDSQGPVVAGISALSTQEAIALAKMAQDAGCEGLMVLPPYVYIGDWREMKAHVSAIFNATPLSGMLYNNPVAYTTDFLPHQVAELLAEHTNLHAIKESSADVRRVAALRAVAEHRLQILCGVDDLIVEAAAMGAVGWIAGLVNAFPRESVELWNVVAAGEKASAWHLYQWFLPLLRMDTVPKFVQLIKLAQQEVGMGNERVRAPRMSVVGVEREESLRVIREAVRTRANR